MQSEHVRDWLGSEPTRITPTLQKKNQLQSDFAPSQAQDGASFGSAIEALGRGLAEPQQTANKVIEAYAKGGEGPIHEQVLALEKSDIQFKFAVSMKNKFIEAYKQTMSMGS